MAEHGFAAVAVAVAFYPGCGSAAVTLRRYDTRVPLMVFHGDADGEVSAAVCAPLFASAAPVTTVTFKRCPRATHDFDDPGRQAEASRRPPVRRRPPRHGASSPLTCPGERRRARLGRVGRIGDTTRVARPRPGMGKADLQHSPIVQSMAACTGSIGARAALQLDRAWRAMTLGHGAEQDTGYLRLLTGEPHPLGNAAIVRDPDGLSSTRNAVTPLIERNVPSMVLYPMGVADAVAEWLVARGYEAQGSMPVMAVDIARLAPTAMPRGVEWVRIGAGPPARAWAEATAAGFGIPTRLAARFSPVVLGADMAVDAQIQFYAMRRRGRIVSTSLLLLADGLAGLYNVSTLAEERGRGLGAHMTAQTLRLAQALGYRVGVLQSSDSGHPVYERLGFTDCAAIPLFVRAPA